jgi:hypothetical protein
MSCKKDFKVLWSLKQLILLNILPAASQIKKSRWSGIWDSILTQAVAEVKKYHPTAALRKKYLDKNFLLIKILNN